MEIEDRGVNETTEDAENIPNNVIINEQPIDNGQNNRNNSILAYLWDFISF